MFYRFYGAFPTYFRLEMELFQLFLGHFLPLFQVPAAAKILFFSETSLLKQDYFLKISPNITNQNNFSLMG
jgi:hypothetical protein